MSTSDSLDSSLKTICSLLISKLNIPTEEPLIAACLAILKTRLLLPKLGLAASTTMSERCNPPPINLSISINPVDIGARRSDVLSCIAEISCKYVSNTSLICSKSLEARSVLILYIDSSASLKAWFVSD